MKPVYNQIFTEEDAKAVYDVVMSQYVTHIGKETKELENVFESEYGRKYSLACSNGTTALHLALVGLNLNEKTIAVPACTFAAVAFAPAYLKCKTVFIDVDKDSWNIDLWMLEQQCKKQRIDAVIAVHNYGNPYDYNRLKELSEKYKFFIIEDACEAIGSTYDGTKAGSMGDVSVFSFYGNKIISGGEGGMLLTDLDHVAYKAKLFRGQAQSKIKFWHEDIGHNFRITNMQSALILSQLKRKNQTIEKTIEVNEEYKKHLDKKFKMQEVPEKGKSSWWMTSIIHPENAEFYDIASHKLYDNGYESRPIFPTLPLMPPWQKENANKNYPVSIMLNSYGITLPSGPGIIKEDIKKVSQILNEI
jgi:perosamine synthetase